MRSSFLHEYSTADWAAALDLIVASDVHSVDRAALRIWSAFFPLPLADAFETAGDAPAVIRRYRIDGNPRLCDGQVDTSHAFLYGHRYWSVVKDETVAVAERPRAGGTPDLADIIREIAAGVATRAGVDVRLVTGIACVSLMTLRQVGRERFHASAPGAARSDVAQAEAPDAIVARRERDDGQGLFGFLRSAKQFSVTFDEAVADARFAILDGQHLTTAAAADGRDYTFGPRRFHEGPIPAQCRSATCGTCWVGVLGGSTKLSPVEPYEVRKLHEFGYADPDGPHPVVRLACQARAAGNVTIVIPSWHGFVAPLRRRAADASPPGEPA